MKAFSPPSLYSKTSYSTARPSHFDQFPRSPSPSILTRKRRLWPWGLSGIVSSSAQVRQEAGALPIDQQFCLQPAADPVVELSRELIHLCLRRLARPCRRDRSRTARCGFALTRPADRDPILVPQGLQSLRRLLWCRVGESRIVARPLDRDPRGWRQRQPARGNVPRRQRGIVKPKFPPPLRALKFPPRLGKGRVEDMKLAVRLRGSLERKLRPNIPRRVGEGGIVSRPHQRKLPPALLGSHERRRTPLVRWRVGVW